MTAGIKANVDGSAAIQVGGTDVITLTSGGAATFVTSPTTVQAGTAAAPSITFSGDTNTGIYSPGADTIAFTEGGVESMRIDSAGRVGINQTPNANQGMLQVVGSGQSWFRFHDTSAGWNFGTFYRANGTSVLGYLGGGGGNAITGGTANDFVLRSDSALLFAAGGNAEVGRFTTGGDLQITNGNVVIGTAGKGIDFSATPGTGTSELLNDYEEGTFAAFISDGTNNTSTGAGSYVKVGKAVSVQIQIYNVTYSGLTAGSLLRLSGLPFPVNDTCNAPISFPLSTYQCLMTQNSFSGTTSLGLFTTGSTPVDWVSATRTRIGGTSISIYASFVYYT